MRFFLPLFACFMFIQTLDAQWSFDNLSQAKGQIAAVRLDTRVLFVGGLLGNGGPGSKVAEIFESQDNSLSFEDYTEYSTSNLKSAVTGHYAIFSDGSYSLVGKVYSYDNQNYTWKTFDNPYDRYGYALGAVANKAFFAGGRSSGTSVKKVDIYDFATETWNTSDQLSEARTEAAPVTVGQKLFFIGGAINISANELSNKVDVYDAATNTWSSFQLSQARKDPGIAVVGNKIIVAGGQPSNNLIPSYFSKKVDIIDVTNNTITSAADLSTPNSAMKSAVVGNKAIFVGGFTNKAEIYDVSTGVWETKTLPTSGSSLEYIQSASLGDHAFFAGGGAADANTVFIYTGSTNSWSTYTLPSGTVAPAMMAVTNKVIIAGGNTGFSSPFITNQVAIYTDASIVDAPEIQPVSTLSIAPNPTTGRFQINWSDRMQPDDFQVSVTDLNGKTVLESNTAEIELSPFSAGMYHVQVRSGKDIWNKMLVKQ